MTETHEPIKVSCYIEEYRGLLGTPCARLRDKETNKKIVITGKSADKQHLLSFLSSAKMNQQIMPTIFDRDGDDIVVVSGYVVGAGREDEIWVCIDSQAGGYSFE